MKKHKAAVATVAVLALALSACSSTSGGGDSAKTIDLWTSWSEGEATATALAPLIQDWAKEKGYTVHQSNFTYDQIHEKLIASAAGGNLPDVVWGLPEYVGEFSKLGILSDLSGAWGTWADAGKVSDAVKGAMTVDGKLIGFPYEATVRAYLVHDKLLEKAGVVAPKSWDDVLAVGAKVKNATGSSFYGVTGTGVRAPQELLVYLAQKGLSIAAPKEGGGYENTWTKNPSELAKAAAVFQFYKDLMASGGVNPNSPTYGWEQTDENFGTGLTATFVSGNWMAEREKTNADTMADVSVHPIPYPSDGKPATYLESKPVFVMANSDSLQASTELAEQFASQKWQEAAFADRSPLSSVTTDSKWSKDFSALLETGIIYPPISLGGVTQNMIDALAMVLQEDKSPQETARWLSEAINKSLEDSGDAAAK